MRKTYKREMHILSIFMVCFYLIFCANKYFSKEVSIVVDNPKIVNNYNSDEFTITASVIKEKEDGTIVKTIIESNRPGEDIYIPIVEDSAYEKGISFIHYMIETTPVVHLANMVKTITFHIWEYFEEELSKEFWRERTF